MISQEFSDKNTLNIFIWQVINPYFNFKNYFSIKVILKGYFSQHFPFLTGKILLFLKTAPGRRFSKPLGVFNNVFGCQRKIKRQLFRKPLMVFFNA